MTSGGFPSDNVALNQHHTLLSCVFTCQMTGMHDATAPLMEIGIIKTPFTPK